jgi:PAS domain S-box-containing protein
LEIYPHEAARFYADDLETICSGMLKLGYVETGVDLEGREHWVQTEKVPYCDKDGKVIGIVVMSQDIMERRQIEEELKQAKIAAAVLEGAQRFLADAVPLIIWTARSDGGVEYYNKAWFDYTGLTLVQTENWGWGAVVHSEDLQPCIDRWAHSVATGEPYEIEYRFKRGADESYRWFLGRASARRNDEGKIVQWVGTCTDIDDQKRTRYLLEATVNERTAELAATNEALQAENAERKNAEESLRASNEKFHQLANNITDAFWIRSPDMREVRYISPAFERIWGRPVKCLYENPLAWIDFIFEKDRERVLAAFDSLVVNGTNLDIEYRIVRPDHEIRWIRVRGFHVKDAANKLISHTGIVSDITERKQAERELVKTHQVLLEISRKAGMAEVATEVLHNVGNVLNSVNVSATLVVDSAKKSKAIILGKVVALLNEHTDDLGTFITLDPKGRQLPGVLTQIAQQLAIEHQSTITELESLRKNVGHIKDIVGMQQNYARVSGVTEIIDVTELVEDAARMHHESLERHNIAIIREYNEIPPITVEKHKVLQILVNLIRNAKNAFEGVTREDKQVKLQVSHVEKRIRIAVVDNGVGILPENLTRIFNHGFTTRKAGHGFGLHSGALAAKEMGGSLAAKSDGDGKGAKFILILPMQPPKSRSQNYD